MTTEIIIKLKPYLREFINGMLKDDCISSSSKPFVGRLVKILIDCLPKDFNTYMIYDTADKSFNLQTTSIKNLDKINVKRVRDKMKLNEPLKKAKLLRYKPVCLQDIKSDENYCIIEIRRFDEGVDNRGNLYMSEKNQHEFENLMDDYFKSMFFQYMDDKARYYELINGRVEFKKLMYDFCADYNLTLEKINYEMLKKAYYRYRNSKEKIKIFSRVLSLSCPLFFLI